MAERTVFEHEKMWLALAQGIEIGGVKAIAMEPSGRTLGPPAECNAFFAVDRELGTPADIRSL